ncbi:MAG: tetratricopeptide repeat protein [Clostridium sp.]|nr:tetratricopeptide repeat protein [Clostridium sp.]
MTKIEILEYIRTILIALLVALVIASVATGCSKVIAEHHSRMLAKISNNAKDTELIGYLISKYNQEAIKNPGDYSINVRLGNLYELLFSYDQAEEQYKKAISKSPYGVYSSYLGLANLYVKMGRYNQALNIVKRLKNTNHKPLLVAKGDFYMNLGDALWEKSKFEDAVKQYKIAFFYYKKVDSTKKDSAINGILDCYNKIADVDYRHHSIYHAIESLETALLYKETPIIYYKLAVLYKDIDPMQANSYMEKTYKTDPGIINFDIYEEILLKLINYYYYNGKDVETDLYKQKLKIIKNFQKRYVITEDDVKINIISLKYKENFFKTKKNLKVKFKIENSSKYDFNSLFLIAKLRDENKSIEVFSQRFYSKKKPLKSRTESQEYKFRYSLSDKDEMFVSEKLFLDFYAGKKDNMRKIPVFTVELTNNLKL